MLSALLLALALPLASAARGDEADDLRLGQRMYRDGTLPSGKPMQALVKGDLPVEGTMFSCVTCHLRSGIGSVEGDVRALPISSTRLYAPRLRFPKRIRRRKPRETLALGEPEVLRPAYTDTTLARALREGIDPSGRTLGTVMPRYRLDDREMALLIRYLKSLSAKEPPGLTDTTVRFASVVTEGVDPQERDAMFATLEAYASDRNAVPRRPRELESVINPMYAGYQGARRLELDHWELKGPPETWRGQLDALQRARPVFALLGGLAAGEWRPIHEFCEAEGMPCLFPITALPVTSETDWHTLYFSKGLYGEGQAAARYLLSAPAFPAKTPVVQLLRDTPEARALARGFAEEWTTGGRVPARATVLRTGDDLSAAALKTLSDAGREGAAVLWLDGADISAVWKLLAAANAPRIVVVSGSLLGEALGSVPEAARSLTYVTYPNALPEEQARRMSTVEIWLHDHNVPLTRPAVQSRAYFVGSILSAALALMGDHLYRDSLLDVVDTMTDQTYAIAPFERLSFGHGQRFASKGCYVVQLGPGPRPPLLTRSGWVVR